MEEGFDSLSEAMAKDAEEKEAADALQSLLEKEEEIKEDEDNKEEKVENRAVLVDGPPKKEDGPPAVDKTIKKKDRRERKKASHVRVYMTGNFKTKDVLFFCFQ